MKKILNLLKEQNKKNSSLLIGTYTYFKKSPSNILLKQATQSALEKYAINKSVLDAGAGRLAYRSLIQKYAKKYTSFDFTQTHSELTKVTNIEAMDFKDSSFDVVFCSQVIEHVPHPWIAFQEIFRVLKPSGIAIITVPMLGYIHNAPHDYYRYTHFGLRVLAEDAGLTVNSVRPLGGFFCFLGYIRSTILMPLFGIPILGKLIFYLNYFFSMIDIKLDQITKNDFIFPLDYILIAQKQ